MVVHVRYFHAIINTLWVIITRLPQDTLQILFPSKQQSVDQYTKIGCSFKKNLIFLKQNTSDLCS